MRRRVHGDLLRILVSNVYAAVTQCWLFCSSRESPLFQQIMDLTSFKQHSSQADVPYFYRSCVCMSFLKVWLPYILICFNFQFLITCIENEIEISMFSKLESVFNVIFIAIFLHQSKIIFLYYQFNNISVTNTLMKIK